MNLLKLAWRNIIFRPLQSSLSVLLLALGVGLVVILLLLQRQLNDNFDRNLAGVDLILGAKGSPLQMVMSSMYQLDAPTGNLTIDEVRPFLNPRHPLIDEAIPISLGDNYRGFRIVGATPNLLDWYGGGLAEGDLYTHDGQAIIGPEVAAVTGLQVGDSFMGEHGIMADDPLHEEHAHGFVVRGILEVSGTVLDRLVLTTNQAYWEMHGEHEEEGDDDEHEHDHAESGEQPTRGSTNHQDHDHEGHDHHHHEPAAESSQEAQPSSHNRVLTAVDLLEEDGSRELTSVLIRYKNDKDFQSLQMGRAINENTDIMAVDPAYEISKVRYQFGQGERVLRLLAIVIMIVSALSVFISLFNSLRERRYELALMRGMGAGRVTIFGLIVAEGLLLGLLGFLVGMALGHGVMELLSTQLEDNYGFRFAGLQWLKQEWWLLLGALGVGLIAAVLPAWQAAETDIAETLI